MIPPRVASVLRRTAELAVERPRAGLWTLLALTCALACALIAAIAAASLDRWAASRPEASASMVVYLGEGVDEGETEARAAALAGELRRLGGVVEVELVPAAESARRLVAALGSEPALLEGLDPAALPASVEVRLAPGVRDVLAMSPSVRALRGAPGVADVVIDEPAGDRGADLSGAVRTLAWAGAALLAGLALLAALATIRVRLDRGRRELAVARLLGAGPGFLAVPAALAGALSGLAAAGLAALGVGLGVHLHGDRIAELSALGAHLAAPGAAELAAFLAAGAILGGVGGGLAGASRAAR